MKITKIFFSSLIHHDIPLTTFLLSMFSHFLSLKINGHFTVAKRMSNTIFDAVDLSNDWSTTLPSTNGLQYCSIIIVFFFFF